jgi:hypothetical protein
MSLSPFSFLGEGLGMRACESKEAIFFSLCSVNGEWHSKTKTSIGVDAREALTSILSQRERKKSKAPSRAPHARCLSGKSPLPIGRGDLGVRV